ncbi:MAG: hypothetical protein R3F50_06920 [Gammaproteobacteria bacterium]
MGEPCDEAEPLETDGKLPAELLEGELLAEGIPGDGKLLDDEEPLDELDDELEELEELDELVELDELDELDVELEAEGMLGILWELDEDDD